MEQHQPSWIKLLFFFLIFMGADLMKQVIVHHFAWLDVLQLMNFLIFILLSFFLAKDSDWYLSFYYRWNHVSFIWKSL